MQIPHGMRKIPKQKARKSHELKGKDNAGYAWHISKLVMYRGMPRELSEFKKAGFMTEDDWLAALYPNTHCHYEAWAKKFEIEKPPQSWCYIEEVNR